MRQSSSVLFCLLLLAACNQSSQSPAENGGSAPKPVSTAAVNDALAARVAQINNAQPAQGPEKGKAADDATPSSLLIRAEVLLARARFSPGVIDGKAGTNLAHAIAAYQSTRQLPQSGQVDKATWQALTSETPSARPVANIYTLSQADVSGPFAPDVGEDFVKLAALPQGPLFTNSVEALAEHFHMSQDLLKALNPGADFNRAGQQIIVVDAAALPFAKGEVDRIDVTKSDASVHAFDAQGRLIAFYPATVGSSERPSPSGTHKVKGVAWNATYTYDPDKLAWGPRQAGKLVIKPGPNNPVGVVWIDLNAPSYGIHGTPDPDNIGKTASHGCVRLTNWDAMALAGGVRPGVTVHFIGER